MSTLKTTNLQNADASSANIVLGQGSGGGATITGVTTTTTLQIADDIIHTGDTNTKIRFPDADTVSVETGGSERARIDSAGRLMLATTSTSGISGSGDDIIIGSIGDSTSRGITFATTNDGTIRWADSGDNAMGRIQYLNNTDIMSFHTSNAERVRITSTGAVGIRETAPDDYYAEDLVVKCAAAEGGITVRSNATTDTNYVMFADGTTGNERYRGYLGYHHNAGGSGGEHMQIAIEGNTEMRVYSDGITLDGSTATANRINDYEEGSWTPTIAFGGGTTGITYHATTNGRYTKVGRAVNIRAYIMLTSKGSDTGNMTMHGLPFNSANVSGGYTVISSWHTSMEIPGQGNILTYVDNNGTTIRCHYFNTSNGDANNVTNSYVNNNTEIMIQGTYYA